LFAFQAQHSYNPQMMRLGEMPGVYQRQHETQQAAALPSQLRIWARGENMPIGEAAGDMFESQQRVMLPENAAPTELNIREAMDRYYFLGYVFETMTVGQMHHVVRGLDRFTMQDGVIDGIIDRAPKKLLHLNFRKIEGVPVVGKFLTNVEIAYERRVLLEELFTHTESDDVQDGMKKSAINPTHLPSLLNDRIMYDMLAIMLQNPDDFRFQIGAMLSQMTYFVLPNEVKARLEPIVSQYEFRIEMGHKGWFLCSDAEPRLLAAMKKKVVVDVNDSLLVKGKGKLTALCYETFTTNDGYTFVEGMFYSPLDNASRSAIREAFDDGVGHVTIPTANWAIMRQVMDHGLHKADGILQIAKTCADTLPDQLPETIGRKTRKEYRESEEEED
jgi:hypothetical protein